MSAAPPASGTSGRAAASAASLRPMSMKRRPAWLLTPLGLILAVATVSAADLSLLSAGAVEAGLARVMDAFRGDSGHTVTVQYGTGPQLTERLAAGATSDVLIAPANVMDQAAAAGQVVTATRVLVGRVGIGVMTRPNAAPDISSTDALRRALLAADRVVYTRGSSGQYIDTLLAKLGLQDALKGRLVQLANGEAAMDAVAAGSATSIGFGAITEIRAAGPKIRLVGPLPAEVQNLTSYDGAVRTGAREPAVAASFLRFAATPAARQLFLGAGVQ